MRGARYELHDPEPFPMREPDNDDSLPDSDDDDDDEDDFDDDEG